MIVKGLNQDLYLVNNAIWVDIEELDDRVAYLELTVTNLNDPLNPRSTRPLRLYPFDKKLRYNLQEVIKGNFPTPKHPDQIIPDADLNTNYVRFRISVVEYLQVAYVVPDPDGGEIGTIVYETEVGTVASYTKMFIRGGRKSMQTNLTLAVGDVLKDTPKIPRWGGYPLAKYYIGNDKKIKATTQIENSLIDDRKILGCDPLYVRFLNSSGGYSFWLFESFEETTKTDSGKSVSRRLQHFHTGHSMNRTLQAETRVKEVYWPLIEALYKSPEVHLYQQFDLRWAKAVVLDSDFSINNYDTVQKVTVDFDITTTENPSVVW